MVRVVCVAILLHFQYTLEYTPDRSSGSERTRPSRRARGDKRWMEANQVWPCKKERRSAQIDVPGKHGQKEIRVALGYCRDEIDAMLKLRNEMKKAGVLDIRKSPGTALASQHVP